MCQTAVLPRQFKKKVECKHFIAEHGFIRLMDPPTPTPPVRECAISVDRWQRGEIGTKVPPFGTERQSYTDRKKDSGEEVGSAQYNSPPRASEQYYWAARQTFEDDFSRFVRFHQEMRKAKNSSVPASGSKNDISHSLLPKHLCTTSRFHVETAISDCQRAYYRLLALYAFLARAERRTWSRASMCFEVDDYLKCYVSALSRHFEEIREWAIPLGMQVGKTDGDGVVTRFYKEG